MSVMVLQSVCSVLASSSSSYLHVLQGHHRHTALGSSLHQLGAEVIHDHDGLEDLDLTLLPSL